MIDVSHEDCIALMERYKDNAFDLAIVDPPFGIGKTWKKDVHSQFYRHKSSYKSNEPPGKHYFDELFRVSRNQIIFGANYFARNLPERNSWIFWDKCTAQPFREAGEFIWTSFNHPAVLCRLAWDGNNRCCRRIGNHPHEKPMKLYSWLLTRYAKPDWNILDTHLGSGAVAIACINAGLDLTACEIDETYYKQALEVINTYKKQQELFTPKESGVFHSLFEETG